MSLNWKEINFILEELELEGSQIQKAVQSAFDVLCLRIYGIRKDAGKNGAKSLLISISPLSCRFHETFDSVPKSDKPLRFAEFLNSRVVNGRIEEAIQLGNDRVIRLTVRRGEERYRVYARLWSNAANVIVTDMEGNVLDAMRRLPKKGEVSGGVYRPELLNEGSFKSSAGPEAPLHGTEGKGGKEYQIRDFPGDLLEELPADASFNQKIDAFYRREGGSLSLDSLREEARRKYERSIDRVKASLERLREKEADFSGAERFKGYGDIILSNLSLIKGGDEWLETENFDYETVRIKLNPTLSPAACAEEYYEQYRKAKSGITELRKEIEDEERELSRLEETLASLVSQGNPLVLHRLLKGSGTLAALKGQARKEDAKRPGLSFRRGAWLIVVGRDASENDALLRRHVKGNDLWLHARDYAGAYVFVKQQAGKTVPLDILLDAGNLAVFYSKGRNSGEGDLFYTQVKYLRRAKDGPKGLVIPTQEKNLHVKLEQSRLRELEDCRVAK